MHKVDPVADKKIAPVRADLILLTKEYNLRECKKKAKKGFLGTEK